MWDKFKDLGEVMLIGALALSVIFGAIIMVANPTIDRTPIEMVRDLCQQYDLICDVKEVP